MSLSFSQPFPLFQSPISSPAAAAAAYCCCCCCCRTAAGCWLPTAAATSPSPAGVLVLLLQLWCCCCCYNSSAAAATTAAAAALLPLAAGCRLLPTGYYCRWLLATDYVLFYPIEYRSGTSPKPGSNVLFPSALPLASAGVGGYIYICIYILLRVTCLSILILCYFLATS